ncbi:MAG TPA: hypothetical protein VGC72_16290 [Candidatus Elarobacter sp.]|jgi:hypothetical protein
MRTSEVSYGSLTIPLAAKELVDSAFAYLSRDAVERSLIRRVEQSPVRHRMLINHRGDDSYDSATHVIRWDPTSAMRTTHGGRQSPSLGLAHELDHAAAGDLAFGLLASIPDRRFDNVEERRVILGSERHAARTLHESTRDNHRGRVYRVDSPVDR